MHDRESHKDILDIIKSERANEIGGVFHCFSGSKEMAREVLNLGFRIGLGGAITFKNARRSVEVLRYVPLDMLWLRRIARIWPLNHTGKAKLVRLY